MKIPHQQLSSQALQALVEEFVSRDGTDYGNVEISLEEKTTQVIRLLDKGDIVILFDTDTEEFTIVNKNVLNQEAKHVTNRM